MLKQIRTTIIRSTERARRRRQYEGLMQFEDWLLRDIGLDRDEVRRRIHHGD